jgi:hypothetical protein
VAVGLLRKEKKKKFFFFSFAFRPHATNMLSNADNNNAISIQINLIDFVDLVAF